AGSVVIALCHFEIHLLSAEEYFGSWQYVPVLSMAMIFSAFASFMGSVYVVAMKSFLSFWTAMAGAGMNVLLNLLLIPAVGIQGAAAATLASYLLSFGIRAVSARRLIPFRLYTGRLVCSTVILAVQTVFTVGALPMWPVVQAICFALLVTANRKPIQAVVGKIRYL
ncbi:MAG: polysaccharide biosynthesis C-terminal domain-containing protein, partial [Lachnospiraceae bacterium]